MKIKDFIDGFEKARDKELFVNNCINKRYLDYELKIAICRSIIKNTMYQEVNGKNMFVIDSPKRWMFFVFSIISNYTEIEMPDNGAKRIELFNEIEKHDVMRVLSKVLGKDYKDFSVLLDVMVEDEIKNNDLRAMLETKIEALSMVASKIPWERLMNNEDKSNGKNNRSKRNQ